MSLATLRRVFRPGKFSTLFEQRSSRARRPRRRRLLDLEAVESRTLLSTLWVSPNGSLDGHTAYRTISAAVAAASSGDTLEVGPGTYNESPTINKTLTLLGAEQDVNPNLGTRTNPSNESTVDGVMSVTANNVTINGFTNTDPSAYALEDANGVSTMSVVDNIIDKSDVGVVLFKDSGATVSDNAFSSVSGQAVDVNPGATNDVISSNSIQSTGLDAIDLTEASGVEIMSNSISSTGGYAIGLNQATDTTIEDNSLIYNGAVYKTDGGIDVYKANNNLIESNTIEYAASDGIDVSDASGNDMYDNSLFYNGTSGQGQGMLLSGVTGSNSNLTQIYENNVSNNHTDGVEVVNSSYLLINDNTVNSNGGEGISLNESTDNWVQWNSLSSNGEGITLLQANGTDVDDNQVLNSVNDGIDVGDDGGTSSLHNEFSYNTISGNGTVGQGQGMLLSTDSYDVVYDNTVKNNHTDGIEVVISSSHVLVSDNAITGNGGGGLGVSDTSNSTFEYNLLSGNADGIALESSTNNTIYDNTAENNSYDGIWLDANSKGNTVSDNTMSGNGHLDAEDDSVGDLTAGTANTWTGNTGKTDNHNGGLFH